MSFLGMYWGEKNNPRKAVPVQGAVTRKEAAAHEARHREVARALGARVGHCMLHDDQNGETLFHPKTHADAAVIAYAGGIGGRHSSGDLRVARHHARLARISPGQARSQAQTLVNRNRAAITRSARALERHGRV